MWIVVDVEADGPVPGLYSMVSFGAVAVTKDCYNKKNQFFAQVAPISDNWKPDALAISNITRQEHYHYPHPMQVMHIFDSWLSQFKNPVFVSDGLCGDWQFINYYLWKYVGHNAFGYSGRRIADLWCGYKNDMHAKWKDLRITNHTHNPVDDALGNVEALIKMQEMGLDLNIKD